MFAFNLVSLACHAQEKVDRRPTVFSVDECK